MATTTIKVAAELRQRMEAFGRAVRGADQGYWDEFREWDVPIEGDAAPKD